MYRKMKNDKTVISLIYCNIRHQKHWRFKRFTFLSKKEKVRNSLNSICLLIAELPAEAVSLSWQFFILFYDWISFQDFILLLSSPALSQRVFNVKILPVSISLRHLNSFSSQLLSNFVNKFVFTMFHWLHSYSP